MENITKECPTSIAGYCDYMLLEVKNDPTWTDLHEAAYRGNDLFLLKATIEQTLRLKNTVDTPDKFGQTPLWWAVHNRKKEAVQLLLQYGARVEYTDMFKHSVRSKMEADPILRPLLNQGFKP